MIIHVVQIPSVIITNTTYNSTYTLERIVSSYPEYVEIGPILLAQAIQNPPSLLVSPTVYRWEEWYHWSAYKNKKRRRNKLVGINSRNNIVLNRKMLFCNKVIYIKNKKRRQ